VATLLDEEQYLCFERTMYRVLVIFGFRVNDSSRSTEGFINA